MKQKKGTICIAIGLLCLAAALVLTIYNIYEGKQAEQASKTVLSQLDSVIEETKEENWKSNVIVDREMPTIEIDGYRYIGVLEIEAIELRLPVMEEWDYERLKIAPCRYAGSVYQDNMIIAGHNYARHFSPIKNLPVGTEISFTDVEGVKYQYVLQMVDILGANQGEALKEGDWDLSLFTCTYGGGNRYVARCVRITE